MMNRRTFLSTGLAAPAFTQSRPKPNVILILTDDQGYGDLSCHGNPALRTPNLDALHASSTRLTDFHVAPMCTPTRSQLLTGRHALVNLAMNVSSGRTLLRRDLPTMANFFASSGYATGQFGKWHLGDSYPYRPEDRGFQESVWFPSSHVGSASDYWNNDYYDDTYRHRGKLQKYTGYCTDVFFREAMNWMRAQQQARRPFFAFIPTNAPHGPLFVPEEHTRPYKHLAPAVARFFGMIANIDDNVGRLESFLKETGIDRDTILIFMTDNGATAGLRIFNAGMRAGKVTLWDGGHRVPCFIRWPNGGIRGGRNIATLTHAQDILPTLTELCGLQVPAGTQWEGASLAGALRGTAPAPKDRPVVVQFSRMNVGRPQWGDATVMMNQWRLVSHTELYDIAADPAQQRNVADAHPEIAARLRTHYEQWWREVEPRGNTFLPVHIGSPAENPTLLSPTEWADSFLDQGTQIRAGVRVNGMWHVHAERAGEYEFTLCRWPRELNVPMRTGVPAHKGECGEYAAGVALPLARAELKVQGRNFTRPVNAADTSVSFRVPVSEGRTTLQTWLYDEGGRELCGAYFVYAEHKG